MKTRSRKPEVGGAGGRACGAGSAKKPLPEFRLKAEERTWLDKGEGPQDTEGNLEREESPPRESLPRPGDGVA